VVVLRVLDELRIARPEQQGPEFLVLAELGRDRLPHNAHLDGLPVRAEFLLATSAKTRGQHRRIGLADLLAVALILKLLGLEIVFRSRPDFAVEADGIGREVRKLPELVANSVEVNDVHFGSLPLARPATGPCHSVLSRTPTTGLRRSVRTVSRQTPRSWAIRSRRPTSRNPQARCSRRLASFSGNVAPCSVQM